MTVDDVLEAVVPAIPIESVALMMDENSASAPEAHSAIRSLLPDKVPVELVDRATFFAASKSSDLALVIATADPRHFACVLLTIGVL
jgi:L-fucose mutarotase